MMDGSATGASFAADEEARLPARDLAGAMLRGLKCRCPNCGEGALFQGYLRSVEACAACGEEIHHHRADDLPPYLTVFVVGHLVVALFMALDEVATLSMWTHLAIWVPATIVLSLAMLRPLKGATIGLQWALRLGGFGPRAAGDEAPHSLT